MASEYRIREAERAADRNGPSGNNAFSRQPAPDQAAWVAAHPVDAAGAKIGMWLFLFTELLLFGGLFLLFSIYFARYAEEFRHAGRSLDRTLGTVNTVVLITSSYFVALAVTFLQRGRPARARVLLLCTTGLALIFLGIKFHEWAVKFGHGLFPGGTAYLDLPPGEMTFFNLYYLMTGLHAVHVIIGLVVLLVVYRRTGRGLITPRRPVMAENAGLYWHLVDLIWIYLFPLFYLAL